MSSSLEHNLSGTLAELDQMDMRALKALWQDAFHVPPPLNARRDYLQRAMAWHLQAQCLTGLRPATIRHLKKLVNMPSDAVSGTSTPGPHLKPGTRLLREWRGETQLVEVMEDGFLWNEQCFASLSAVATAITGTRWSGPRFFGLGQAT